MYITWEDRKGRGQIDDQDMADKPAMSFNYAWFHVTDTEAEFVKSHDLGVWNEEMSADDLAEVTAFYNSYVFSGIKPAFDESIEKLIEQGTEVIDGKTYSIWVTTPLNTQELGDYTDQQAAKQRRLEIREDLVLIKADAEVLELLRSRPADIDKYINTNVNNLAGAKKVLKIYGRALAILAHTIIN